MSLTLLGQPLGGQPVLYDHTGAPMPLSEARDYTTKELTELWRVGADMSLLVGGSPIGLAYKKHPTVYRAINTIANQIGSVPAKIHNVADDKVVTGQEINALFDRPSPRRSTYDLFFAMAAQLEWSGNACVWMDFGLNGKVRPGQLPKNLVVLNSRALKPIVYADAELIGYEYTLRTGVKVTFSADEIMHVMFYNPENPWWGQSTLEAAGESIGLDQLVHRFSTSFFQNSAQIGGILIHKGGGDIGSKKVEAVQRVFDDRHVGVNRAHRPAILSGNWEYHSTGLTLNEMALLGLREFLREDIGSVFNVPNIYLNKEKGVSVATATVESRIFAETNWLPKIRMLEAAFRAQFFRLFAPGMYLKFDVSEQPGIREDVIEKIDTFIQLADRGVHLADIIRLLGLNLPIHPDYETHFMPFGMVPAEQLLDGDYLDSEDDDDGESEGDDKQPDPNDDTEEDDENAEGDGGGGGKETKKKTGRRRRGIPSLRKFTEPMSLRERSRRHMAQQAFVKKVLDAVARGEVVDGEFRTAEPSERTVLAAVKRLIERQKQRAIAASPDGVKRTPQGLIDDPDRDVVWRAFVHTIDPIELRFKDMMRTHFFALRKEVLKNIGDVIKDEEPRENAVTRASADDATIKRILFDLESANVKLSRKARAIYKKALQTGGDMMLAELDIDESYDTTSPRSISYINKRANKLAGVNRTVWNHVRDQLRAGIEAGESAGELAQRLKGSVFNPAASRARTIARTETLTVVNHARVDVMKDEGIEQHEWLSARDENVRQPPDCPYNHACDGDVVAMGETFPQTGLRFPLDDQSPDSVGENIINCRCTTLPVV